MLLSNMTEDVKSKMKKYDIQAVPTAVIDGEIKVVGIPDFPWICGDELYTKLKRKFIYNRLFTSNDPHCPNLRIQIWIFFIFDLKI